jgi:hypothetical protein
MDELFANLRAGIAKRLGEVLVAAIIATPVASGLAWIDYRDWRRSVDDLIGEVRGDLDGCATHDECQRRGAEIDGLKITLADAVKRVDALEHYRERHHEGSQIYKRRIDECADRVRDLEMRRP